MTDTRATEITSQQMVATLIEQKPNGWVPEGDVGSRLVEIRRALKLTIEEIADFCDVPRPTWSTWERGVRPQRMVEQIPRIAERLRVDPQ